MASYIICSLNTAIGRVGPIQTSAVEIRMILGSAQRVNAANPLSG